MKILLQAFLMAFLFCMACWANLKGPSPVGYWKTIDDQTGKPKSILQLYQSDNILYGQVIKIFPGPGHTPDELCSACLDDKHNQPIVGMVIAKGLKQDNRNPLLWEGGSILDPASGKTYRCYLNLARDGQKLKIRGYIGIALLGRTQTWLRVNNQGK